MGVLVAVLDEVLESPWLQAIADQRGNIGAIASELAEVTQIAKAAFAKQNRIVTTNLGLKIVMLALPGVGVAAPFFRIFKIFASSRRTQSVSPGHRKVFAV